jgi:hypothetical protein
VAVQTVVDDEHPGRHGLILHQGWVRSTLYQGTASVNSYSAIDAGTLVSTLKLGDASRGR